MTAISSPDSIRSGLPAYHAYQCAFHEAFRRELYRALDRLPLPESGSVLDAPCGSGFYSRRLASRLAGGRLVAADTSDAYLELASRALEGVKGVEVRRADVYHLPFSDGTFDLAWCAQSLISLDDPAAALDELVRVVRPGGVVAVLESDEVHHVLLPWPVDLELAVHRALLSASQNRYGDRAKLAPARRVRGLLRDAGLWGRKKRTIVADRLAPWTEADATFLRLHLTFLEALIRPHLSAAERDALTSFLHSQGPDHPFSNPDAEMTCLNVIHLARKPSRR